MDIVTGIAKQKVSRSFLSTTTHQFVFIVVQFRYHRQIAHGTGRVTRYHRFDIGIVAWWWIRYYRSIGQRCNECIGNGII
jgi:hypothetical protein